MADRTTSERINFGKLREVLQPPNLIEIQITSYLDFLQKGVPEKQRKPQGLEAVFREVFPIQSYDERLTLEYVSYTLGDPKNSEIECLREGITYSVPLYVKLRLREEDFIKDEEIYMGEIPMVTERGSFIINGAERVVVSQLHRSPGIAFEVTPHPNGKPLHSLPHHSGPRHLARGPVRQQRPALRLSRPPPPPPQVPHHDPAPRDRLRSRHRHPQPLLRDQGPEGLEGAGHGECLHARAGRGRDRRPEGRRPRAGLRAADQGDRPHVRKARHQLACGSSTPRPTRAHSSVR